MADLDPRWGFIIPEHLIQQAIQESPDGLVHAGLSTDRLTLCERGDDTWLGPSDKYVRLNLDLPGAAKEKKYVSCIECLELLHA